ncbi:MAG: class I SAM-dependent methyltransferase [Longimicrobiales bacterium]
MARTVLGTGETRGLGTLRVRCPPDTFALTPASRITVAAVGASRHRLQGAGIDWGSGVGCVAIAAARVPAVRRVIGLEIRPENVRAARDNAAANGVADRVRFFQADSYAPAEPEGRRALAELEDRAGFVVANPPASTGDDGFGWRREVARGAIAYLRDGGALLVQVSSQYGMGRVRGLEDEAPGLRHDGVAASTGWVPFDMRRPHLLRNLETFAAAEAAGQPPYAFRWPGGPAAAISAREALGRHRETGRSPLSRWQVQRFVYRPSQ